MPAKKFCHHIHVDQLRDASRKTGATAAGAVSDIAEADIDFFHVWNLLWDVDVKEIPVSSKAQTGRIGLSCLASGG